MIEIKYDNNKENLLRIQKRIQERELRNEIKSKIFYIEILHHITDYDINSTIHITDNGIQQLLDFSNINYDNMYDDNKVIDSLNYDELNTLYNILDVFEKDLNKMEEN